MRAVHIRSSRAPRPRMVAGSKPADAGGSPAAATRRKRTPSRTAASIQSGSSASGDGMAGTPGSPAVRECASAIVRPVRRVVTRAAGVVGRLDRGLPSGASQDGRASRSGVPSRSRPSAVRGDRLHLGRVRAPAAAISAGVARRPGSGQYSSPPGTGTVSVGAAQLRLQEAERLDAPGLLELVPVDPVLPVELAALARLPDPEASRSGGPTAAANSGDDVQLGLQAEPGALDERLDGADRLLDPAGPLADAGLDVEQQQVAQVSAARSRSRPTAAERGPCRTEYASSARGRVRAGRR